MCSPISISPRWSAPCSRDRRRRGPAFSPATPSRGSAPPTCGRGNTSTWRWPARPEREVEVTVLRNGREERLKIRPDLTELRTRNDARFEVGTIGVLPDVYPSVASFVPGKPAESSGLKVDDVILAIDGERVVFASQIAPAISKKPGDKPIEFRIRRDGVEQTIAVTPYREGDRTLRRPVSEGSDALVQADADRSDRHERAAQHRDVRDDPRPR